MYLFSTWFYQNSGWSRKAKLVESKEMILFAGRDIRETLAFPVFTQFGVFLSLTLLLFTMQIVWLKLVKFALNSQNLYRSVSTAIEQVEISIVLCSTFDWLKKKKNMLFPFYLVIGQLCLGDPGNCSSLYMSVLTLINSEIKNLFWPKNQTHLTTLTLTKVSMRLFYTAK